MLWWWRCCWRTALHCVLLLERELKQKSLLVFEMVQGGTRRRLYFWRQSSSWTSWKVDKQESAVPIQPGSGLLRSAPSELFSPFKRTRRDLGTEHPWAVVPRTPRSEGRAVALWDAGIGTGSRAWERKEPSHRPALCRNVPSCQGPAGRKVSFCQAFS